MDVAKIKITGTDATVLDLTTITSGMIGATVSIEYDDTWEGLNKQVVFKGPLGAANADGNTIPPEVLRLSGHKLEVGVYGYTDDGSRAIPTIWASLGMIQPGADPEGDETAKPTLPVWTRMQNQIGNLDALKTKAKDNLVAAINELQAAGVDEKEIQRIIGEYLKENEVGGKADLAVNDPNAPGYVANRTHWKEIGQVPLDIRWDGGSDNSIYHDGTMFLSKVSDTILSVEELRKCTIELTLIGENVGDKEEIPLINEELSDINGCVSFEPFLFIVYDLAASMAAGFPFRESGMYFVGIIDDVYTSRLFSNEVTMPGVVYHPIPQEYLPEKIIPTFDLAAMGVPALTKEGDVVSAECDTAELIAALESGSVRIRLLLDGYRITGVANGMKTEFDSNDVYIIALNALGNAGAVLTIIICVGPAGIMLNSTKLLSML